MSRLKTVAAIGAATVTLVLAWEGLRTKPYYDSVGVLTVCVGETQGVKKTDVYTPQQCKDMLVRRLDVFEAGIRKCLKNPDAVPAGAYVASISLAYNVGISAYCGSSIRRKLDAGDVRGACDAFLLYNKAGGRYLQGLANRRKAERAICLKGTL
jgi:lysozyme